MRGLTAFFCTEVVFSAGEGFGIYRIVRSDLLN